MAQTASGRRITMDQIDIDSTAAIQHRMSYGQYIAKYGHVRDRIAMLELSGRYGMCAYCGSPFELGNNRKFCSKRCQQKAGWLIKKQKIAVWYTKTCGFCGSEFTTTNPKQKYCNVACRAYIHRQKDREYQQKKKGADHGK